MPRKPLTLPGAVIPEASGPELLALQALFSLAPFSGAEIPEASGPELLALQAL
jgi:hypothetical protein